MPSIILKLKKVSYSEWQLFAPKGHEVGPRFRGDEFHIREQARNFLSSWYNFTVDDSDCYSEGEKNHGPKED